MSSRRLPGRAAVVLLAAALAVSLLAVSTRTWLNADLADPLTGQSTVPVPGSTAAAVVPALALVALAAAGALTISRRVGRVVALVLIALAAVGAGAAALGVLGDPQAAARAAVAEATGLTAGSVTVVERAGVRLSTPSAGKGVQSRSPFRHGRLCRGERR